MQRPCNSWANFDIETYLSSPTSTYSGNEEIVPKEKKEEKHPKPGKMVRL
jgi:hypothetical protein